MLFLSLLKPSFLGDFGERDLRVVGADELSENDELTEKSRMKEGVGAYSSSAAYEVSLFLGSKRSEFET